MKLLIDAGNTALKWALANDELIKHSGTVSHVDDLPWQDVSHVLIASVKDSPLLNDLIAHCKTREMAYQQAAVSAECGGIKCGYSEVQNLGVDRWLAVLGAAARYPHQDLLIVDAGTATTLDALNRHGHHLGGFILPGLDLMVSSVVTRTQKVFTDTDSPFNTLLGTNTPQALKNGCFVATLGAIEHAATHELPHAEVLVTGGYGELIAKNTQDAHFFPELVLEGLLVWGKQQGNA